jgi:RNA ligase (TIGR02306 family)
MSEFSIRVVKVGPIAKHPNADNLSLVHVNDYPVVIRTGEFRENDLAVYVCVDAVVPADDPRWEFLKGHNRIKAKRLRGVFSMGLLAKAEPGMTEGEIVAERMRITKYEPPEPASTGGEAEKCPFDWPKYTDLESIRRYPDVLQVGEEVILTEKIHGTSARYVWMDGRVWVGSHKEVKRQTEESAYWKPVKFFDLEKRLAAIPGIAIYGEVYGWVQDLRYGHKPGMVSLVLFDAMDLKTMRYLDVDPFLELARMLEIPTVPIIYRGPWKEDLKVLAEGTSLLKTPIHEEVIDHVREGFVVRPVKERFDERIQRVALKYHGEGYLTR